MNFENPTSSSEKPPVSLTREQFDEISNYYGEWNDQMITKLGELGIELDSGDINITIDGKPEKMVTDRNDFGTLVDPALE